MPELPEVETIKRGLEQKIVNLKIENLQVLSLKSFQGNPKLVLGKKIASIKRRAKILVLELEGDQSLVFHLKMSGQLIYESLVARVLPADRQGKSQGKQLLDSRPQTLDSRFIGGHPTQDMFGELPNKHTRVVFTFSDSSKLYFNDQRRFGWIRVIENGQLTNDNLFKTLGPEPLEESFTWEILKTNLQRHKTLPIKVALLDQTIVAGLGNIYANEALFYAGINPSKKVSELTDKNFKALHKGIVDSLNLGVQHKGSTLAHFTDEDGNKGYFLNYAYVYGLNGKPCKNCGNLIEKIQLRGRGTFFCPNCQT